MSYFDNQCLECKNKWEVLQRWSEPTPPCPECGSVHTERLLSVNTNPIIVAGNPYDALDTYHEDCKPIKSFARDRRKGGRNTV